MLKAIWAVAAVGLAAAAGGAAMGQPTAPAGAAETCLPRGFAQPARYRSTEVLADGRVTFRLCAPAAKAVRVITSDMDGIIPNVITGGGLPMTRDPIGLWSATTDKPVPADTYRFDFEVDGARVPDPLATRFSEERTGVDSVLEVPGPAGAFQAYDFAVPHGAVSVIEYVSPTLGKRRAHVYTPPGYMRGGTTRYPVLYLVHGAGDSDDSWTSVGHAQYILDNLIAAGRAKPMIVVMPFGHTPDRPGADMLANTDFGSDLTDTLIPLVDAGWRTVARPEMRAMAGLSMGGAHTLNFGLPRPDLFRSVGIFSMGLTSDGQGRSLATYEARNAAALDRAARQMKLVYYAVGRSDFVYGLIAPTRALLDRHRIAHVYNESDGGHTWINWRRYLADFAPRLFR